MTQNQMKLANAVCRLHGVRDSLESSHVQNRHTDCNQMASHFVQNTDYHSQPDPFNICNIFTGDKR